MQILKNRKDLIFFIAGFFLTLIYIFTFKPVSDIGDAPDYLKYAQSITENSGTTAFVTRSPFYSWILALFISWFGKENAIQIVVIIQYLLLFSSSFLVYKILINNIFSNKTVAILTTVLLLLNFSALFYSYMVLTETMTSFLLIASLWFIIKGLNGSLWIDFFISGLLLSVTVLTRFNTLPIVLVFAAIIQLLQIKNPRELQGFRIQNLVIFLIPVIIILNGYAFINYMKHDFYGLFPTGGSGLVSRNALIKTIDGSENVSAENLKVLEIFKKAGETIKISRRGQKGSLIRFDKMKVTDKLYGGFLVYSSAKPELCKFFEINPKKPEPELSVMLTPFYNEIRKINRGKVWELRFLSLLNSFRSSSGIVIPEKPGINLGMLPGWSIQIYKLTFFTLTTFVFISSLIYLILVTFKSIKSNKIIVIFILTIFGFFFINFAYATSGDANRFKYPVEPLIISIGIYYFYNVSLYFRRKIIGS